MKKLNQSYEYDVAFSFAGAQRNYVNQVKNCLKEYDISVFYDDDNSVELWGKNLYRYLDDLYTTKARYCVVFISEEYAKRPWTIHESQSAQERAFFCYDENNFQEYILPVIFDDTRIPGIRTTTGYMDARKMAPKELAAYIAQKVSTDQQILHQNPESIEALYQYIISTATKLISDTIGMRYEKTDSILEILSDVPIQTNLLTVQDFKSHIFLYVGDRFLGINPSIIVLLNHLSSEKPIKLINFTTYFGQFTELDMNHTEFESILIKGLKRILEVEK